MNTAFAAGARLLSRSLRTQHNSPTCRNGLSKPRQACRTWRLPRPQSQWQTRAFTATGAELAKQLPPRRVIPDSELEEYFLKGSGPGGQKIVRPISSSLPATPPRTNNPIPQNKTNSAVQLKHLPTGLVVKCQETRSRDQNRKLARRILGEKLEEMELGDDARTKIKGREIAAKKASKRKKSLRKYRKLEEEKKTGSSSDDIATDIAIAAGARSKKMDGNEDGNSD
jgi:peptide chain release factor